MVRTMRRGVEIIRSLLSREQLPEDPVTYPQGQTVFGSIIEWLLKPEDLPQDPVLPKRRKGFFSTFLGSESLPQDPEALDRS